MVLHTLNKSSTQSRLFEKIANRLTVKDSLLLLEDGVYCACINSPELQTFLDQKVSIYAIQEDLDTRGLTSQVNSQVHIISYDKFVELTLNHTACQSWF